MNRRLSLSGALLVVCLATLWGVWGQRSQLAGLRAEQRQLLAQSATHAPEAASNPTAELRPSAPEPRSAGLAITPELLRLRSEVTRLAGRRRELAGVAGENETLRTQLASRGTSGAAGIRLPQGYIRRSEARMVGYHTPDDTLQSLLWAIQNHDLTNMLQAFSPERIEHLRGEIAKSNRSPEDFFRDAQALVGMGIVRREQAAAGDSMVVEVEMIPGLPRQQFSLRRINEEWKIDGPL